MTRFNTENNAFGQQNGFFKYIDKRFNIFSLYNVEGHRIIMSHKLRWERWSHVTCRSTNIFYYL